jgi:hypothetical protein
LGRELSEGAFLLQANLGDRRQETGDRRQETGDRRQETGDRGQELQELQELQEFGSQESGVRSAARV